MSSKFSPSEKKKRKLEKNIEEHIKASMDIDARDDLTLEESQQLPVAEFEFAGYDEASAERGGYMNYSYWRSTVIMFSKNKLAMSMLLIMLALVLFTFIQPLLPDQYDPNVVNYYNTSAVWVTVDEDSQMTLSGIKYTKGDLALDPGSDGTLAYITVPDSWGVPAVTVQAKGATEDEAVPLALTADSANKGWYYAVVPDDMPYMIIRSEDGTKTTYYKAAWITVDEESLGVTSVSTKLTEGDLPEAPEGMVVVYINTPKSWGTPTVKAQKTFMGTDAIEVSVTADPANDGWYYAFIPAEMTMVDIGSEDGSVKGKNKGTASVSDPTKIETQSGFISNQRPGAIFWFGTNDIGQDLWARMWSGSRTSLLIGIAVATINAIVGITIGLIWGYVRKLDFLLTELYNLINNIPSTIILMLVSFILRPSVQTIIIAMCITGWIDLARFIRNLVLMIRDRDFNLASRCLGTPTRRVIIKNLLPQMVSVVMLRMALAIPEAIGAEVFLAYIGLGLPIDIPSLGNLVNKGRSMMMAPSLRYQLWIPAIILSVITICFYMVGNAFADAADPKNHV